MVAFEKNIEENLPYNRERYIGFLDDDFRSSTEWYAVSLQLDNEMNLGLIESVDILESVFTNIILKLDNNTFWVINHDDKDLNWFPNNNNKNLTSLRLLFEQNNIQNTFRGSLIFMKEDLFKYAKDLISYPYILSYKNLDITHSELQFVVKITDHLTIDLLSTDKELLKKIINEDISGSLKIKEYRGNSLWT